MATPATIGGSEQSVRTWVEGFEAGWRAPRGPAAFAAHFRPMLDPDVRMIQPMLPTIVGHGAFEERFVKPLFDLIPDVHGEVERWASHGETIFIELTLRGTLAGRPVSWRVCDRVALSDGVAIERESYFDPSPLLAAVLATPRAWPGFLGLQARNLLSTLTRRRRR